MKQRNLRNTSKLFCFLFFILPIQASAQDIIDYNHPKNIFRFAEYLYNEGDYLRAIGEYQRYIFVFDSLPSNADSVFYKMGLCYRLSGNFTKAIDNFAKMTNNNRGKSDLSKVYYQIALTYSLMDKYNESIRFLNSNFPFINEDNIKLKANQLIALNHILQKEWNPAVDFLDNLDAIKKTDSMTLLLLNYANEGKHLPRKNKLFAGLFSSIIPGSGKIYCNRSWDGFFSLLTIGLTSWQAYEGFHKDGTRSVKGWIFGSLSAVFYLGNIYGSIVSAQIYNEQQEGKFLSKVKLFIDVDFH
jgi:tetratricopeptide (TPR) repeat protein